VPLFTEVERKQGYTCIHDESIINMQILVQGLIIKEAEETL
jgi:hypothetical protein